MVRRFIYILLSLAVAVSAVSCLEEMEVAQPKPEGSDETILVPRVKSFTNQYITKGYAGNETKITNLALLVFNSDGALVHLTETSNAAGISSITLNKSLLNSPQQRAKLTSATVVMIANVGLDNIKKSDGTTLRSNKTALTLEEMEQFSINFEGTKTVVTSLGEGFTGFPMIGGKKGVDLSPTADQQPAIEVGMKILYAKINFSISVAEGTENKPYEGVTPSFTLNNYSVFNASMVTTLAIPEEEGKPVRDFLGNVADESVLGTSDEATASSSYTYTTSGAAGTASGTTTLTGNNPVNFTFYVSESRYNHNSDLKGIYPDDNWLTSVPAEDVKGYTDANIDQLNGVKYFYDDLIQQYKPKLVTGSGSPSADNKGMATYVILDGSYTDYRGTVWDVEYKVYLGKDNAHNFHVDRNSEYTNLITIKGIRNNDSYGDNTQSVWIDHRVNVSTGDLAGNVTITRETLIDSHFEVRPLRVKVPENTIALLFLPRYNGTQIVETENGEGENWIAIENNNGRVKDITQFSPNGKRKYFTTSLIKQLHLENKDDRYGIKVNNNTKDTQRKGERCIQLMTDDDGKDPCVWIYIDQNISESDREAEIELVFYDNQGNETASETFNIIQSGLENVGGFLIEKYEEYLHTYDSQDLYTNPLTDYTQQGYKWGLNEISLSKNQNVVLVGNSSNTRYYYDYFHAYDKQNATPAIGTYEVVGGDISKNSGLNFTHNVVMVKDGMTIIDMSTRPESAIQYCLSKNKFKVDESDKEQHTMDIHWYLPDVYEMADILSAGQNTFPDFAEYAYWTSQPAWTSVLAGAYLIEDTENARSVSLDALSDNYTGSTVSRNTQQRIRCAYSETGLSGVSFAGDRAPEGIGAMRFYMRAWKEWSSKEVGYFYDDWIKITKSTPSTPIGGYTEPDTYAFPKVASDDPDNVFGGYKEGYGFKKDPSDSQNNWKTEPLYLYGQLVATNYVTLGQWPGLTTAKVVKETTYTNTGVDVPSKTEYYTLNGEKTETKGTEKKTYIQYDEDITSIELNPLDHLLHDRGDLSIAFMKESDATNSPVYEYYKDSTVNSSTTTRVWLPPTYKINYEVLDSKDYSLRTPGGQILLSDLELETYNNAQDGFLYKKSRANNAQGYIYITEADAINAGKAALQAIGEDGSSVSIPEGITKTVTAEQVSSDIILCTYYTRSGIRYTKHEMKGKRYRYRIKYTIQGDRIPYYGYDKDGKWSETSDDSETTIQTPPTKDALRMYGGNSFTIKANNGNVISSVKIYFSDSNVVDERGTGYDYLRFTNNGYTGEKDVPPPGMSYSANGNTGTMTWSGEAVDELTFKLVLYREDHNALDIFGWLSSTGFQYIANTDDSKSHSIIIDQIDVRYKKADTTNQ